MDTKSLRIGEFETQSKAQKAGFDMALTPEEFAKLAPMNTLERKSWLGELSEDEIERRRLLTATSEARRVHKKVDARRAASKAARKARRGKR